MNFKQLLELLNNDSKKNSKKKSTKKQSTSLSSKEYVKLRKNKKSDKKM